MLVRKQRAPRAQVHRGHTQQREPRDIDYPSFASGSRPVRSRTSFANDTAIGASMPYRADGDSSFISMPKPSNTPPVATCSPLPSSAPASAPIISVFACGSVLSGANR